MPYLRGKGAPLYRRAGLTRLLPGAGGGLCDIRKTLCDTLDKCPRGVLVLSCWRGRNQNG